MLITSVPLTGAVTYAQSEDEEYTLTVENTYADSSVSQNSTAGGISFFASDLILSQIFFVKGKCTRLRVVLNHITYYGAQILIASSLFFMK